MGWKGKLRKGPWTFEEDIRLLRYIKAHGDRRWSKLAKEAGLQRCGRSCRLRWVNYLRPDIKRGNITPQEERIIIDLHGRWGSRWSLIAERIPGRTDNEIKNYWRSHLKKKLQNSTQTQNIGGQNYSLEAQVQAKQVILPQKSLKVFTSNAIKDPLSYENNHNLASIKMGAPMDKLNTEEMIRDMEKVQVQVQVEASFLGTSEVEGSIQNDMGIARNDAIELSLMPHSFLSGIPIESYAMGEFEDFFSTKLGLMHPTHECQSNLGLDIMMWNMDLDKPFLPNMKDFTGNTNKTLLSYEDNHNHSSRWMETSIDKFCIEEMIRDMEQVQVQVQASFVGTSEVEGSSQNDISILGCDTVDLSAMPYSFISGIPIENYAMGIFEDSYLANPKLMYPTHECEFD